MHSFLERIGGENQKPFGSDFDYGRIVSDAQK